MYERPGQNLEHPLFAVNSQHFAQHLGRLVCAFTPTEGPIPEMSRKRPFKETGHRQREVMLPSFPPRTEASALPRTNGDSDTSYAVVTRASDALCTSLNVMLLADTLSSTRAAHISRLSAWACATVRQSTSACPCNAAQRLRSLGASPRLRCATAACIASILATRHGSDVALGAPRMWSNSCALRLGRQRCHRSASTEGPIGLGPDLAEFGAKFVLSEQILVEVGQLWARLDRIRPSLVA